MNSNDTFGFLHVIISRFDGQNLLFSNDERAYVITQLQDLLSPRLLLLDTPDYKQLASCIDLLAFSVTKQAIHLLLFTVDTTITKHFAQRLCQNLQNYQYIYHKQSVQNCAPTKISLSILSGPHQALSHSVLIHLFHSDWEFDRYSSIGFYLHDRRGDWMRFWRLAKLYHNNASLYRQLVSAQQTNQNTQHTTHVVSSQQKY